YQCGADLLAGCPLGHGPAPLRLSSAGLRADGPQRVTPTAPRHARHGVVKLSENDSVTSVLRTRFCRWPDFPARMTPNRSSRSATSVFPSRIRDVVHVPPYVD